jgi:hypothetical protein
MSNKKEKKLISVMIGLKILVLKGGYYTIFLEYSGNFI